MKKDYRKLLAILLASAMTAGLFGGCAKKKEAEQTNTTQSTAAAETAVESTPATSEQTQEAAPAATEQKKYVGNPWNDSSIPGNLDDTCPRLQDDYYQATNYEVIKANQSPAPAYSVMQMAEPNYNTVIKGLLNDASYKSDVMDQVRILYSQAMDFDKLIEQGAAPLQTYVTMVESASTIEELNTVITGDDFPFNPIFLSYVTADGMDKDNIVTIQSNLAFVDSKLGGAIDYQKELNGTGDVGMYLNQRLQYVAAWNLVSDPATADEKNSGVIDLVKFEQQFGKDAYYDYKLTEIEYGTADQLYTTCSIDELQQAAGNLPVKKMLEKEGRAGSSRYVVQCIDWLKSMAGLYKEENLNAFKQLFIYGMVTECINYISPKIRFVGYEQSGVDPAVIYSEAAAQESAYNIITATQTFSNALASIFVQETKDQGYIEALTAVTEDVINTYKKMMTNCTWVSDSAREALLMKLDTMRINILVPESGYADFSKVKLKKTEEGGTLLENYFILKKFNAEHENQMIGKPATSDCAWNMMGGSTMNAFYDSDTNSVSIVPGFVNAATCDMSSTEKLYAAVGVVIGHEISHGFDIGGSAYDYNGDQKAIFTGADKEAYLERIGKFNAYLDTISITEDLKCNGELISQEATADLCGMAVVLEAVKAKENFNYEEFFERFSYLYAQTVMPEYVTMTTMSDGHPQHYLRVNVTNQMFDEFYKTYSVTESDKMYLTPEKRCSVWW